MIKNGVIGFPRVGRLRELKFASEKYFRNEITEQELQNIAMKLRKEHWHLQKQSGIDYIPSNDFSLYDGMLDLAVLLNVIPKQYSQIGLNNTDTYFAMARGYQSDKDDVKALAMKKWFNTNYHYLVPEISDDTEIKLTGHKLFEEYVEAKTYGIETKPVVIGGFTFLKLAQIKGSKVANDFVMSIVEAYITILDRLNELGAEWIQIDEPSLVTDLDDDDINLFKEIYSKILPYKGNVKVLIQTYFGDIRDCYKEVINLDFDGIGLDFIEGKKTLKLINQNGFPEDKVLFAGVVNGRNIWRCNYKNILDLIAKIQNIAKNVVINTSCSLLHVPYTIEGETQLTTEVTKHFSFAQEKLVELKELTELANDNGYIGKESYTNNQNVFSSERVFADREVQMQVANLKEDDFVRAVARKDRLKIQSQELELPVLPTTTIGSFPQTIEVKKNRTKYRKCEITKEEYDLQVKRFIKECIEKQEKLGLDVLVHGEYERNDMVEFFGENLSGYIFTEKAWVQSYGTRCVKPPIIFGDVKRVKPITISYSKYAQSLTKKPVKGMLTGPVTILNWSFQREDISLKDMAYQIGLAIRDEVTDLEEVGIKIIQIDEAALKEKLPIRKEDWHSEYLDWAIRAFRLCHSKVQPRTQIHTHMCYSEFEEIIEDIDNMDADVISFEASRSKLTIIDALSKNSFETQVGPGVYDVHSPRIPSTEEIIGVLKKMLLKINKDKLWVNPDCGLKTRGIFETDASLKNLVEAVKRIRNEL